MEDIKREIYEQDAIEEKQEQAYIERMESKSYMKCSKCDKWVTDTTFGVCDSCINEIIDDTTLEDVIEYASTLDTDNELVLYTEYLFTKEQAIEILKEYARNTEPKGLFKKDIKEYIENDTYDYIEYLDKKGDL